MSENSEVTKPLKDRLEQMGFMVLRLPTGGYRGRMMLLPKGTPDLLVFRSNIFSTPWDVAVVETKKSCRDGCPCKSCSAQRATRVKLEARKVLYVFARSVDAALVGLGLAK